MPRKNAQNNTFVCKETVQQKSHLQIKARDSSVSIAAMVTTKFVQRQEALLTRRQCPECGKVMLYHTLMYKHVCRGNAETKKKWLLERMDQRILERGVPGSEAERLQRTKKRARTTDAVDLRAFAADAATPTDES